MTKPPAGLPAATGSPAIPDAGTERCAVPGCPFLEIKKKYGVQGGGLPPPAPPAFPRGAALPQAPLVLEILYKGSPMGESPYGESPMGESPMGIPNGKSPMGDPPLGIPKTRGVQGGAAPP